MAVGDDTFTYDITFVVLPDEDERHTRRLTITDPRPEPGYGPSLGVIHRALRNSDPRTFGHITSPDDLVLVTVSQIEDPA